MKNHIPSKNYEIWTEQDDMNLINFMRIKSLEELTKIFGRTENSIVQRIDFLEKNGKCIRGTDPSMKTIEWYKEIIESFNNYRKNEKEN